MMRTHEVVRLVTWIVGLIGFVVAGCSAEDATIPARSAGRWTCPAGWVVGEHGGCGPAVLLCVPGGGAGQGACDGVDVSRPAMIALPDGGAVRGFYRLPDGGIGGAWPEPGDPDGPPDENWVPEVGRGVPAGDWAPDAGIVTCATGWRRLPDGTCDPMLRTDCPDGSGALPGGSCTPTALANCPAGEYAELGAEAVGARVVHVRAGADAAAADGSVERPYATIAAGMRNAGNGGWVRVAAGEYRERIGVAAGVSVHVVGVCAARVTLRGPASISVNDSKVLISGAGGELDLRGVTITGTGRGIVVSSGAALRATALVITDNDGGGVLATSAGTRLQLGSSVVRETRPSLDGNFGRGVEVFAGASARLADMHLVGNADEGIRVSGSGTMVEVRASVIQGTRARVDGAFGYGLGVSAGAQLRAVGTFVDDNTNVGIRVAGAGTQADLVACAVRGTRPRSGGAFGYGLQVTGGAELRATGLAVVGNSNVGVLADSSGTRAEVHGTTVRRTLARFVGTSSTGLVAQGGAALLMTGTLVADNDEVGVLADDESSRVEMAQCVVRDTRPRADGNLGSGLVVRAGGELRAVGVLVVNNSNVGATVKDLGSRIDMAASVVRGTRPNRGGLFGYGLSVERGATLRAEAVLVSENTNVGLLAGGAGTQVEVTGSVVSMTRSPGASAAGEGVSIQEGAALLAEGLLIEDNIGHGLRLAGTGTHARVRRTAVRRTRVRPDGRFGHGVEVNTGASLYAEGVLVAENIGVGLFAWEAGTSVHVVGSVVRGPRSTLGSGVSVQNGATLRAERLLVTAADPSLALLASGTRARVDLTACIIGGPRSVTGRFYGPGLVARAGATLRAVNTLISNAAEMGICGFDAGTEIELIGSAVRGTRPNARGFFGRGLGMQDGVTLRAAGLLLADNVELGLYAQNGGAAQVTDLLVAEVSSSARGFGVGLFAHGGTRFTGTRVSIHAVAGAGVVVLPRLGVTATRASFEDLFVRGVRPSTVRFNESGSTPRPEGRSVAYGLHTGEGCGIDVTRATLLGGGFGFYNAGGFIRAHQGVIAGQLDATGAIDLATPASAVTLDDVARQNNVSSEVLQRDDLPTASSVPPLPPVRDRL